MVRAHAAVATVVALSMAAAGCAGETQAESIATAAATTTQPRRECRTTHGERSQGAAFGSSGTLSATADLGPTPAISPAEADLEAPARHGRPLTVTGTVFARDCATPLAGVTIEVWQTDRNGEYGPGHGTGQLRCCYLHGAIRTRDDGTYAFNTVHPAPYRGADPPPPAHIHFNVRPRSGQGLGTELDFAGDPQLPEDDAPIEVVAVDRDSAGREWAKFDIVLDVSPG
jgi:protocatechuate 3,4-dioxygenase beta subunit